jgi:hypothetical protein
MKKVILNLSLLAIASSLVFTACNNKNELVEPDYSELGQQSADNSSVQRESDQAINDANTLLEGSSLGARLDGASSACDVDSSSIIDGKRHYKFKYKGTSVDGKVKSGRMTAVLTAGANWGEKGAVLTLTFDTMKVVRAGGKSVTFSGTKTITNVTGGRVSKLKEGDAAIEHAIVSSDLKITFEDGTTKTWSITKTRSFTKDSDGLVVTITGLAGTNVAESGITRKGTPFSCSILTPIVMKDCGGNDPKPVSGVKVHKGLVKETYVTYGVDGLGNTVNSCNATSFKVNWLNRKGDSQQAIVAY